MNDDDQNRDAGRPDERSWQDAQSSDGQQGQSQSQQFPGEQAGQQQTGQMFEGSDDASDAMAGEEQTPGYGDQGMSGQGADRTGGTSVTGEAEDQDGEADLPNVGSESDLDNER